jgi:hypothetical protein
MEGLTIKNYLCTVLYADFRTIDKNVAIVHAKSAF